MVEQHSSEPRLSFRVQDRHFSVPSALVTEVLRMPRIARVPLAPPGLLGLANLRGDVIPVLSLSQLLMEKEAASNPRLIVIDAGEPLGLAVDSIGNISDGGDAAPLDVDQLIARNLPATKRKPTAQTTVSAAKHAADDLVSLIGFDVGGQHFALPLDAVEEIARVPSDIARLPHGDTVVLGSAGHGSVTLPILSLAALLALPSETDTSRARLMVVQIGTQRVGLVVGAMRSILRVPADAIDPVPQVLTRGSSEARVQAICRLEEGCHLVSVLATDQLLRDDITQKLLQSRHGAETMTEDRTVNTVGQQYLTFRMGQEEFALPVDAVEEVTTLPERLTRLPNAPTFVQGVMNLRGDVIPVIDQRIRFSVAEAAGAKPRVIVVRIAELRAGFVVDAVSQLIRFDPDALRPAPDFGTEGTAVIEQVVSFKAEDRIILILSPRELLDRTEQDLLTQLQQQFAQDPS